MNNLYIRELRFDSERFAAASLPPQDKYLRSLDILSRLDTLELTAPITFLTGENGSGKSTLIEANRGRLRLQRRGRLALI